VLIKGLNKYKCSIKELSR